jgi:hypothetical protein
MALGCVVSLACVLVLPETQAVDLVQVDHL